MINARILGGAPGTVGAAAGCALPRGAGGLAADGTDPLGPRLGSGLGAKKAGGKNRRGFPPAPPGIKPLAGARSIFCVCAFCNHLFLAKVHQTRFGNAYSEKRFFAGFCSVKKSSHKKSPKRKSPNQGTYMGCNQTHCRPAASLSPKQSERAASGFKDRVQGGALRFFPPAFL